MTRDPTWMPGGFLSLSANGAADGSGVLWITMPFASNANRQVVLGVLRALDASDVSKPELWDSENTGNGNDRLGQFAQVLSAHRGQRQSICGDVSAGDYRSRWRPQAHSTPGRSARAGDLAGLKQH